MCFKLLIALSISICISFASCGYLNTAFRTYDNQTQSVMVDVKQRAIISGKLDGKTTVICAEPSPDALSAYAAEIAASVNNPPQIGGQLSAAAQEGSAYVGLRTQSIQLLRDSMYRLCEGYMNGAISSERFDILARRYQKNMVALLAIEQLTATVKAPPVTINTQSNEQAIKNPDGSMASGSTNYSVLFDSSSTRSDEAIKQVANTVREIVNHIVLDDDSERMCLEFLSAYSFSTNKIRNENQIAAESGLIGFCVRVLEKSK